MTYELNHIRYNWKVIGGIAGIAGIIALVVGLCFAIFILYAFSGFLGYGYAKMSVLLWAGGVVGIAGFTVAAVVFALLSALIAVYNHLVVSLVGGLSIEIQPHNQS